MQCDKKIAQNMCAVKNVQLKLFAQFHGLSDTTEGSQFQKR